MHLLHIILPSPPLIRTLSAELRDGDVELADCTDSEHRPGSPIVMRFAPDLADRVADLLRLAAALARARDDRQCALPLERLAA